MPLSIKEIKENVDNIQLDLHFELRLKRRHIDLYDIKYHLANSIPIIQEINEKKYKVSYQLEKQKYLTMYILKIPKGLKILTVFIENRINKV